MGLHSNHKIIPLNDIESLQKENCTLDTKELNDFPSFNLLNYNDKIIIQNSLVTIETYLKELYEENDDAYFICFLLLIYNFRRYFSIKGDRKIKHNKNKKK